MHEVKILNIEALNCMTLTFNLIKSRPYYKAVLPVTCLSVGFFGFPRDLQPLPQPPRGCKEAHKEAGWTWGPVVPERRGGLISSLILRWRKLMPASLLQTS